MENITPKEVETLLNEGTKLKIIDVREGDEFATGNIPGAVNIPISLIEFRMHELEKSKEYIIVCRSGGRSGRATKFLESYGFNVINMTGGMLSWEGIVK
ncbi:rhodanese-like domain-containing protein [Metabacillus idriensis]|uniref:rhodanese-like domain-containing protein n=1 Tax=Metabacillus idriensis TaxID=324768 RepID=UPI00174ADC2F|nr:rhodanese-like domain-containing protein [Metabacillus idriensis]